MIDDEKLFANELLDVIISTRLKTFITNALGMNFPFWLKGAICLPLS